MSLSWVWVEFGRQWQNHETSPVLSAVQSTFWSQSWFYHVYITISAQQIWATFKVLYRKRTRAMISCFLLSCHCLLIVRASQQDSSHRLPMFSFHIFRSTITIFPKIYHLLNLITRSWKRRLLGAFCSRFEKLFSDNFTLACEWYSFTEGLI